MVADPVTTAKWELALAGIEEGRLKIEDFMAYQAELIRQLVEQAKADAAKRPSGAGEFTVQARRSLQVWNRPGNNARAAKKEHCKSGTSRISLKNGIWVAPLIRNASILSGSSSLVYVIWVF